MTHDALTHQREMQFSLWNRGFCYAVFKKYTLLLTLSSGWLQIRDGYSSIYWFGQHGFWMMQNSGNQVWVFQHGGVSVLKFDNLSANFIKTACVTNLRDDWNWASRKDTEIHGAAIGVTTAVDVTLCWGQVTHTQSSNCRNKRGGMQRITISR